VETAFQGCLSGNRGSKMQIISSNARSHVRTSSWVAEKQYRVLKGLCVDRVGRLCTGRLVELCNNIPDHRDRATYQHERRLPHVLTDSLCILQLADRFVHPPPFTTMCQQFGLHHLREMPCPHLVLVVNICNDRSIVRE
jgi:hypothetical protein